MARQIFLGAVACVALLTGAGAYGAANSGGHTGLNPDVAQAVARAEAEATAGRAKAAEAQRREHEFREAAARADDEAASARFGEGDDDAIVPMRGIDNRLSGWAPVATRGPFHCDQNGRAWDGVYYGAVKRAGAQQVPNGFGVLETCNGDRYAGEWANGAYSGKGVYSDHHYGQTMAVYHNGRIGDGPILEPDGRYVVAGSFSGSIMTGTITTDVGYLPDEPVRERVGQTCHVDKQECYKVEYMRDGTRFAGRFVRDDQEGEDLRDGPGALFDAKGNLIKQGTWRHGEFAGPH